MNLALDSGAHSFFNKYSRKDRSFAFFESDEFWEFADSYVNYLIENKDNFSIYVGLDVVFNPELSWKNQKYFESKGLHPLPVYHAGEDILWLKKYLDNYEYFGLGGLGQRTSKAIWYMGMGDHAFDLICDGKGYPRSKIHGFAMTSPDLILEYPFYSVDSTSWMQFGKYGLMLVPKNRNGVFVYDETPHIIAVSTRKKQKDDHKHFDHLPKIEQTHIHEYLESIGLRMGKSKLESVSFDATKAEFPIAVTEVSSVETIIEIGVCNDITQRDQANLRYYLDLESAIPEWPRPWKKKRKAVMTKMPGA